MQAEEIAQLRVELEQTQARETRAREEAASAQAAVIRIRGEAIEAREELLRLQLAEAADFQEEVRGAHSALTAELEQAHAELERVRVASQEQEQRFAAERETLLRDQRTQSQPTELIVEVAVLRAEAERFRVEQERLLAEAERSRAVIAELEQYRTEALVLRGQVQGMTMSRSRSRSVAPSGSQATHTSVRRYMATSSQRESEERRRRRDDAETSSMGPPSKRQEGGGDSDRPEGAA